jgi:hypothetical protein
MKKWFEVLVLVVLILIPVTAVHAANDLKVLISRFSELKVMQEDNLPIRFAQEDWNKAKQMIVTDESWKTWVNSNRVGLDAWISKTRDQATWVGGYQHALIDPTTKQPIRWSANMPEPSSITESDKKFHAAWVGWVRSNNFDKVLEASRMYRLTDDQRYAEWAASQMDFYAENYARWPLQQLYGSRSRMMGQGLDEATATAKLIDSVRLLKTFSSLKQRNFWRDNLFLPIADNLRKSKVGINNISLWHAAAMAEIGLQFDDEKLYQEAINGPMGIRAIMKLGVTKDFIWYEGSLGYQTYVLRALSPLFIQASLLGKADDLKREMLIAQNMLLAPLALRFDDGMLPNPGDSTSRLRAIDLSFQLEMYRTLPTRIGLIEATHKKSWDTLLDPVDIDLTAAATMPVVSSANLESVRMALLKADGWQLFHRYGQLSIHHSQEDALNIEVYYQDVPISTNPATVLYESSLHKDYFHRAISHNVPLVDGQGQVGWNPGEIIKFDAKKTSLVTSQPEYRPDAAASREVSIQEGQLLDRVTVRVKPAIQGEKRLGFLFHSDCQIELVKEHMGPGAAGAPPVGNGFSFWERIIVHQSLRDVRARLYCDGNEFIADLRMSAVGKIYTAIAPSTPLPKKRYVVYVEIVGRDASIEMKLRPVRPFFKVL